MAIKYVAFALDGVKGLTPTERLVLISLAEWADDDGVCWYSQDRIAERVEVSRRQVIRLIDKLESKGIIVRLERLQRSVRYQIRCDVAMSHVTPASYDTAMSHGDVTSGAPDVTQPRHIRCDTAMSHKPSITTKRTTKEPSEKARAKKATAVPDVFEVTDDLYGWAWSSLDLQRRDVDRETEKFMDYHRAKGSTMKDWVAAWRNWMRNSVTFRKPSNGNGRTSPVRPSNYDISAANIDAAGEPDDPFGIAGPIYETTGRIRP
ncbi:MAG: helix-turn-helix domain-containing protein [Thermomicrobiales bacterium]|nr:helix-turn-helix domain-containing protein [Thermomicrobiales bacterium]